jgi:hypothetical protein
LVAPERLLRLVDQQPDLVLHRNRYCGVTADLGDCHWKSPSEMADLWQRNCNFWLLDPATVLNATGDGPLGAYLC